MSKNWYILSVFTGYEKKIGRTVQQYIDEGKVDSNILSDVKVPSRQVTKVTMVTNKVGKKVPKEGAKPHLVDELTYPGYVLVEMDLPPIGWKDVCNTIRRIQGVTGFVGTAPSERPRPITAAEAKSMFASDDDVKSEQKARIEQNYETGDRVKITSGPFVGMAGEITEVNASTRKLKLNVEFFGRTTPLEIGIDEVEKM